MWNKDYAVSGDRDDTKNTSSKRKDIMMFTAASISSLLQLPRPLLTVYLDTNPRTKDNIGSVPGYLTWLRTEAKSASRGVPAREQQLLREQLDRVEQFLRDKGTQQRGLLIFAGPTTWQPISLTVELENELRWGRPALSQLLWLASEYKPYGIVVVDRHGARVLRYWLGEIAELGQKKFGIDISQWKKKDLGHVTQPGIKKTRGSQRDVFNNRMDAQYARLCKTLAGQAKKLYEKEDLAAIFLVGSNRLVGPIQAAFPKEMRNRVVLIEEDLGGVWSPRLAHLLDPKIAEWKNQHEMEIVNTLLGSEHGAVLGIDETLAQLQGGGIGTLILARGLDASLRQCAKCALISRSADPACPACGGERRSTTLREVLPELAWSHKTKVEVVTGEAAKKLNKPGAMGGWLRQSKHGELP